MHSESIRACQNIGCVAGFMHGADDYITKPFYFREVQARVK